MGNIMKCKLLIVVISIFLFLVFIRNIEKKKEEFISNIKKKEYFDNLSIQNVHSDMNKEIETKIESVSNDDNNSNNNTINDTTNDTINNSVNDNTINNNTINNNSINTNNKKCDGNQKDGKCLFGCNSSNVSKYTKKESKITSSNLEDMMRTFEETEKICDAIEKKDKERKNKEALENLDNQLQLNKKFLIQQKAQNKQIEDLQKLIKDLQFDEDMKKIAITKCSGKSDECLSNKEKEMDNILKMREDRKQNLKINLNIDPFGDEYKKKLMKSFNFKENDT